ncbi:MAG: hypothetical protein ACI94Y_000895 [Maribacter sp.]|jgi:hypothetical protein
MKHLILSMCIILGYVLLLASCDDDSCTTRIWYEDADQDGLGNPDVSQETCEQPIGYVSNSTDDDDNSINESPKLIFKFNFDEDQGRFNNIGLPVGIPAGHAAQTPDFNSMSIHYIEMTQGAFTQLGQGEILYSGDKTNAGSAEAVDFDKAVVANEGEEIFSIPISQVNLGTFEWIRTSVTYQNYDIDFNVVNAGFDTSICGGDAQTGTLASFLGYNVYITDHIPKNISRPINDDKLQGFWMFETDLGGACGSFNDVFSGEAPEGATTVVNPLFGTSDIPAGSCVVTGALTSPLTITGEETADVVVTLSYSINNSFEWIDNIPNGELDLDITNPANSDVIVDMGVRGLIPSWE